MPLTHAILKTKQRELRAGFPETMGLRVHRSISWIDRAEDATDDDGRFIFLWIGFNAAYADEEEFHDAAPGERAAFASYFRKVVALDTGQRVYDAIWNNFSVKLPRSSGHFQAVHRPVRAVPEILHVQRSNPASMSSNREEAAY